ncbi:Tetratricopeptide-like helical [Penicillium expansum]|nr:Tetratricopeptide-like helical [Penicillium expansum]
MAPFGDKNPDGGLKSAFRKPTPEETPKTKSVDEIWSEAMEEIAKDYSLSSKDLEKWDGKLGYGETGTEKAQALFANSRHPGDKKDKVTKAVGNCLEWVENGLGFVKNNISGTYAVPVQILTGSISYMVKAAQNVSDDFDLIESTFETLDNALAEIGDLRRFNFKSDSITFLERLTAIFIAMVFRDMVPLQTLGQIQMMSTAMQDMPDRFVEQLQTKLKYSELQPLWGRSQKLLDQIKDPFKRCNLFHPEIEARMEAQMGLVDKQLVGGTFSWTEDNSTYKAWESGRKAPYLFILGSAGSGKTFFACHCYKSIQKHSVKVIATSEDSSERKRAPFVTYFPFKIGREESQQLGNILAYTILQVAMQDTKLRESIAQDLNTSKHLFEKGKDIDHERTKFLWQNLLVAKFERTPEASRELFIFLTGLR